MKLRIAKKIVAAVGTGRGEAYTDYQIRLALNRVERTKSSKMADDYWNWLMGDLLTVADRAMITKSFSLLMRTDERDWNKTANQIAAKQATTNGQ